MKVNPRKAAIIGCGFVGASIAFRFLQQGLFSQLVLVDVNRVKAEGEAMDLSDGLPYAEAMGLGADFAARFGELALEPCAWFETPQRPPVTAAEFYQSFRAVLSRMEAAEK